MAGAQIGNEVAETHGDLTLGDDNSSIFASNSDSGDTCSRDGLEGVFYCSISHAVHHNPCLDSPT